jgi:hypothetical protein
MDYKRRLASIARTLGCPRHEQVYACRTCDASEPIPEPLLTELHALIDAIAARVGRHALQAAFRHVPQPLADVCACGARRTCSACQEVYGRQLFRAIGLTAEEHAQWQTLLQLAHGLQP